jgi:hypothetical protein
LYRQLPSPQTLTALLQLFSVVGVTMVPKGAMIVVICVGIVRVGAFEDIACGVYSSSKQYSTFRITLNSS